MASADPLDHLRRVRLARGAGMGFPVELVGDLSIKQTVSQITDAIDNGGDRRRSAILGGSCTVMLVHAAPCQRIWVKSCFWLSGFSTVISLMSSRNIRLRSLAWVVGACHKRGKSLAKARTLAFCSGVATRASWR